MPSNNVIPDRIQDFLKHYPPFNLIQPQALSKLSERVFIEYHEKDSVIFKQGDTLKDQIFVVRQGAVEIIRHQDGQDSLLDVCDEGEMFGVRPLLADEPYLASAVVREDAILYAIKLDEMRALIEQNPNLAVYLASIFAANVGRAISQSYSTNMKPAENHALIELVSARNAKAPVTCRPDSSVQAAATQMRQHRVGSIIVVDEQLCPLGILTDTDLRNKIATGDMDIQSPVADIMSRPVITVAKQVTLAESLLQMLRYKVHHLCVTEDGSVNTAVLGVVSEHDLMLLQGSSPALILREMLSCTRRDELASLRARAEKLVMGYIEQEVSIEFVAGVISEINDAMIHKAIELA
jgi:CBS domain-containing protein